MARVSVGGANADAFDGERDAFAAASTRPLRERGDASFTAGRTREPTPDRSLPEVAPSLLDPSYQDPLDLSYQDPPGDPEGAPLDDPSTASARLLLHLTLATELPARILGLVVPADPRDLVRISGNPGWRDRERVRAAVRAVLRRTPWPDGTGALVALDVSPRGIPHAYGLAFTFDRAAVERAWRVEVGSACDAGFMISTLTGWPALGRGIDDKELRWSVQEVAAYAFHNWPARFGSRDLDRDVFACGLLEGPWRAVREVARAREAALTKLARNPSLRVRKPSSCPWCGRLFVGRPNQRWCGANCRKAASRSLRTARPESLTEGPPTAVLRPAPAALPGHSMPARAFVESPRSPARVTPGNVP